MMRMNNTDKRVDAYIEALPGWQQDICRKVRALVHAADPEVVETIKRTRQPYFTLEGNICALLAAKGQSRRHGPRPASSSSAATTTKRPCVDA